MARADATGLVLQSLRTSGPASRADLARETGLAESTVSLVAAELLDRGTVAEGIAGRTPGRRGRTPVQLRLHRDVGVVLGIDLGRSHVRAAVVDFGHELLSEAVADVDGEASAQAQLQVIAHVVEEILVKAGARAEEVRGAALGIPGPVHRRSGQIGDGAILPGWVGQPAADLATERLGVPVVVDNDANLGAIGEWMRGAVRGTRTAAYVKVSTGVGAGLIVHGRPFAGSGGTAGEVGHIVLDPNGETCRCGNRGCLETIVGSGALRAATGLSVPEIVAAASRGDGEAVALIARAGEALGVGLATLANVMNPERIAVSGPLFAAKELILEPLRAALAARSVASANMDLEVVDSELGDRAQLWGAVALALRVSRWPE